MNLLLTASQPHLKKYYPVIGIFLLFILSVVLYFSLVNQPASASPAVSIISRKMLEEKYGLRLDLLAVTAAGGMVDLRLKMLDAGKARLLLQDKQNFPALLAGSKNVRLSVDEDTRSQEIKFEENGGLYLMFPNSGNAVTPGSAVTVVFGSLQLEPVVVK